MRFLIFMLFSIRVSVSMILRRVCKREERQTKEKLNLSLRLDRGIDLVLKVIAVESERVRFGRELVSYFKYRKRRDIKSHLS